MMTPSVPPDMPWKQMTELTLKHNTSRAVANYTDRLAAAWGTVDAATRRHRIAIASTVVELQVRGDTMNDALFPALAHLAVPATTQRIPDIVFHLWDGDETGAWPPPPPFATDDYHRYGQRAVAHDSATSVMVAPFDGLLYAYDQESRQGYFWCRNAAELSIYERAAPAQTLFHWALREFGWQVVHAAAVGTEAGGVLLVGNTGAGKSTTALALLEQRNGHSPALRYLSDDKCLVRLRPQVEAFALFNSAKLKADMLDRFPTFRPLIQGWDDEYKAGKSLAFLHPSFDGQMIRRMPIRALVTPQIAHLAQPRLTPVRGPEVFRVLGPSTVIWLPGAEADNFRFNAELARTLPSFRLDLAVEPERNSAAIAALLDSLPCAASQRSA